MCNKKIFFVSAIFVFSLLVSRNVFAEQIDDFQASIRINPDASINVTEKIFYDFGSIAHHGIYRDIPVKYQRNGLNYNLKISQISVSDENGQSYQFSTSQEADIFRIKIGDPAATITGAHYYVINYKIKRAINYFSDHDELYWNVTGNGWTVPINKAEADVTAPAVNDQNKISSACYYGYYSSQSKCPVSQSGSTFSFSSKSLAGGEGMTVIIGFPKGLVDEPNVLGKIVFALEDNSIFCLPLVVLIILFFAWRKYGRDPRDKHPVVAQYDVPDNLTPLEVGTLLNATADNKDLSAEIIYLAVKGYLRITRLEGEKILGISTGTDYLFEKLKDGKDVTANGIDPFLLDALMMGEKRKLSEIKKDTESKGRFDRVRDVVYNRLKDDGYFTRNPKTTKIVFYFFGIVFLVLAFYLLINMLSLSAAISLIISGALFFVFAPFMGQETGKGVETKNYLLGLKLYLGVVEKDRLDFNNAPEKNPQTFEKFLPYAMVFGVEKAWAGQFEGIYTQQPGWFVYPGGHGFSVTNFSQDLHSFSSSANMSMATAARSGSGFGGGGFSGGGFGGGGGGSW
jgi:uncharacterized membrane protein